MIAKGLPQQLRQPRHFHRDPTPSSAAWRADRRPGASFNCRAFGESTDGADIFQQ